MFKLKTIIVISYIAVTALFFTGFSIITYKIFFDFTTEEISEARLTGVNESMSRISSLTESVKDSGIYFVTNRKAIEPFSNNNLSEYDSIVEQRQLTELMNEIIGVKSILHSIEFYTDRYNNYVDVANSKVFSTSLIDKEPWFELVESTESGWIPEHESNHSGENIVSYFHHLHNHRGATVGYIKVNILADAFFESMYEENFLDNIDEPLILIGSNRRIIGQKNTQESKDIIDQLITYESNDNYGMLQEEFSSIFNYYDMIEGENEKYTLVISRPNDDRWRLAHLVPTDSLYSEARKLGFFVLMLAIISLFLLIPIAFWVGKSLLNPINKLIYGMREVENGNFQIRVKPHFIKEYKAMATNFNQMTYQLDKSIKDLNRENRAKREAELSTLQNQIVPHFLYNTLDMIHWRAMDYHAEDISYMVNQLSRMYRIGLRGGQSFMPLRNELEHVKCYINLQRARLTATIHYHVKVPATLKNVYVPKIILQPFVENSIKHGYPSDFKSEIHICIIVRCKEDHLEIEVVDNGCGFQNNTIPKNTKGIGLKNIKERIWLYCGKEYGLELFNNDGTIVRLKLPIIKSSEELEEFLSDGNEN